MKPSLQEYYEDLVSQQSESVKNILIKRGLTSWDNLSPLLADNEREYILKGYSMGIKLRADVFFKKIVTIARKKLYSPNEPLFQTNDDGSFEISTSDNEQAYFEQLRSTLSVRATNVLSANGLYNYEDFIRYILSNNKQFDNLRNCGRKTVNELESIAAALKERRKGDASRHERNDIEGKTSFVNCPIEDLYLSVRTQNCLRKAGITTLETLATTAEKDILKLRNLGRKSLDELHDVLSACNLHFGMKTGEYQLLEPPKLDDSYINTLQCLHECNLKNEEIEYAIQYKGKFGHLPLLHLLFERMITILTPWEYEVFSLFWGLYKGADELLPPQSFKDISVKLDLSEVRVEQLFNKAWKRLGSDSRFKIVFQHEDWKHYGTGETIPYFITNEKLAKFQSQLNEELPQIGIWFWFAMLQLSGIKPYWIDFDRKELFVRPSASCSTTPFLFVNGNLKMYDFCKAVRDLRRLQKIKKTSSLTIPLNGYYISNGEYWRNGYVPKGIESDCLIQSLKEIFIKVCGAVIDNDCIIIEANKISYEELIYEILKTSGHRLHRDELLKRLKERCEKIYEECNLSNSIELSPFLTRSPRIVPVGKSGFWELKEWGNKNGSIREIALEIMRKSKSPIRIDELCEMILKHRPDSNTNSVSCVVRQAASSGELLIFYDDYIGYPQKNYVNDYVIMPQSFDDWIQSYRVFVETNRRHPYCNQAGYEGCLYRWHYRSSQFTDLTSDEILKFDALEKELVHYPQNATEYNFLQNCNLYKKFVESNKRMLAEDDDLELFNWFYKSSRNYSTYNDNRNKYFSQLLQSLSAILY